MTDRQGTAGSGVAASVLVRADLAGGLCSAMLSIHAAGGILPLWSPPPALPPAAPGAGVAGAVGARSAPVPRPRRCGSRRQAALIDPETDPVVVGRYDHRPRSVRAAGWRCGSTAAHPDAPPADWTAPAVGIEGAAR